MEPTITSYGREFNSGRILTYTNGEYFQTELNSGATSILWSTSVQIGEIIELILSSRTPTSEEALIKLRNHSFNEIDKSDEEIGIGPAVDIIEYIKSDAKTTAASEMSIAYVRLPFDGFTLLWRRDARKFAKPTPYFAEISLVFSGVVRDSQFIFKFIDATMTSNLNRIGNDIRSGFFYLRSKSENVTNVSRIDYSVQVSDIDSN